MASAMHSDAAMPPTPTWPPHSHSPAAPTPPPFPAPRPHILMVLQDDLGHDDVAFNGNSVNMDVTGNITALANEGLILKRHYVHWHCSPTRRTALTGRLPVHHSEYLSGDATDDIDLRWTTIAQKLKSVGYRCFWYGKGHTGYLSTNHLPLQLGFDNFTGFLPGEQSHFAAQRWQGNFPFNDTTYSAELYGERAVVTLQEYTPGPSSPPLFFYLPWQNVHEPYQAPPWWPSNSSNVLRGMLQASDNWMGQIVSLLKTKGMWNTTAIFYSADNGGVDMGSNWPLRGEKHTNWEGGVRVAAFISGGFLPSVVRGSTSNIVVHIADWYPTICVLAGVSGKDDPPVPPATVDPSNPTKNIYGNRSFPPVDGVDIWPIITNPTTYSPTNYTAAHAQLWISEEVLIQGRYKIVVAQQEPQKTNSPPVYGWKCGGLRGTRCDTRHPENQKWVDPSPAQAACGCAFKDRSHFVPCLFDVEADPSEYTDLSASHSELLTQMWTALNTTNLDQSALNPNDRPQSHSPPDLLGPCNPKCAAAFFAKYPGGGGSPQCGVPGCGPA